MLAKVFGSALHGVEAFRILVEVNVAGGLGYTVTGQPDDVVRESLSRAEVAIKGLGLHMPRTKVSVNLSPAHIRKTGAGSRLTPSCPRTSLKSSSSSGQEGARHDSPTFFASDELYEFSRSAVEVLRQPMEEGKVRIVRAKVSLEYPASFMLVAAMNPCFCGYLGHQTRACTCSKRALEYYLRKTSGPLMDRIDLQVAVESVSLRELMDTRKPAETSAVIRARVVRARAVQSERLKGLNRVYCNARIPEQLLEEFCLLDTHARRYLFGRLDKTLVSARSYSRILKVSRTIADLAGSSVVEVEHVAEAVHFRGLERLVEGRRNGKVGAKG